MRALYCTRVQYCRVQIHFQENLLGSLFTFFIISANYETKSCELLWQESFLSIIFISKLVLQMVFNSQRYLYLHGFLQHCSLCSSMNFVIMYNSYLSSEPCFPIMVLSNVKYNIYNAVLFVKGFHCYWRIILNFISLFTTFF